MLTPDIRQGDIETLQREIRRKIQIAEGLAAKVDPTKLDQDHKDAFATVESFIARAKESLTRQDFPAASNMAEKARILAEELSRVQR